MIQKILANIALVPALTLGTFERIFILKFAGCAISAHIVRQPITNILNELSCRAARFAHARRVPMIVHALKDVSGIADPASTVLGGSSDY
jgi:hypothetical protein